MRAEELRRPAAAQLRTSSATARPPRSGHSPRAPSAPARCDPPRLPAHGCAAAGKSPQKPGSRAASSSRSHPSRRQYPPAQAAPHRHAKCARASARATRARFRGRSLRRARRRVAFSFSISPVYTMILPPGMQYAFTSSVVCTFTSHCHCGASGRNVAGLRDQPARDVLHALVHLLDRCSAPACPWPCAAPGRYATSAPFSISCSDTSMCCLRSTPTAPGCVVCTVWQAAASNAAPTNEKAANTHEATP